MKFVCYPGITSDVPARKKIDVAVSMSRKRKIWLVQGNSVVDRWRLTSPEVKGWVY